MRNLEKNKIKLNKAAMIKRISKSARIRSTIVKDVYEELERQIEELLSAVDENSDVTIKLFDGISIDGVFVPEKEMLNNFTGETIVTKSKVKPKVNVTRNYCERITRLADINGDQ